MHVCTHGGQRERERERILSRFRAANTEPNTGLDLTNCEIMTAEIKSRTLNRLNHPGAPTSLYFFMFQIVIVIEGDAETSNIG